MSDQQEQQAPAAAPTPGEWLRQERERQGRTVQQIASDLHIGVYMIEAIESNQFSVLGAPVFARGHLRKYTALLGLPLDRAQELYQSLSDRPRDQDPVPAMHRATEPSIPMSPDSKQRRTLQRSAKWNFAIAGGALVLAGLGAWVFHKISKPATSQQAVGIVIPSPADEAPNTSSDETAAIDTPSSAVVADTKLNTEASKSNAKNHAPVALATERSSANQTALQATALPTSPVGRGKLRLRFSFNQESWVEVYDARGTRLLYDVGFPGQTRGVDVDPPAQIVLGVAAAVNTEVNGHAVTVPARRIANQVARFTVGADGAAQ